MDNLYKLSLIICTKNRANQLSRCLQAVLEIVSDHPWQLIIVNNNSADSTKHVIAAFMHMTTIPTITLDENMHGSSAAKNSGWRATNSEFVAFIDDDCYPTPHFVNQIVTAFSQNAQLGFVGGKVLLFDKTDYPITIQMHNEPILFSPESVISAGKIHGANFAFRRAALAAAQGFDIRFGAGRKYPCEDIDTMAEVLRLGWSGAYDPRIDVFHHHGRKLKSEADKLMRSYDKGRGAFYAKQLMKQGIRKKYFITWIKRLRWQPIKTSLGEFFGAIEFVTDCVLRIK